MARLWRRIPRTGDKRKMTVYKFTAIDRTLEFIKPLLIEGKHSVSVRTFYKEYPREYSIDHFEVTVEEIKEK